MLKFTEVKSRDLSDLLKSVNESISVDKELSRCLGYVEVVLKEALNGHKSLAVERFERALFEVECLMNYGMKFVTLYRRQGSRSFL